MTARCKPLNSGIPSQLFYLCAADNLQILTIFLVRPVGLSDLVVEQGLDEAGAGTTGRERQLLHGPDGIVVVDRPGAVILESGLKEMETSS